MMLIIQFNDMFRLSTESSSGYYLNYRLITIACHVMTVWDLIDEISDGQSLSNNLMMTPCWVETCCWTEWSTSYDNYKIVKIKVLC
jgi:hypothetical protein